MSVEEKVQKYLRGLEAKSLILLGVFIVFVIIFIGLWAVADFKVPGLISQPKDTTWLFVFWTIGALLFGAVIAVVSVCRGLGKAIK